jgi:hypothetical protein
MRNIVVKQGIEAIPWLVLFKKEKDNIDNKTCFSYQEGYCLGQWEYSYPV